MKYPHCPKLRLLTSTSSSSPSGEDIRQTIEQDAKAHPNCSHTTMRQTHATLSKTENLTRIIRQCQGLPPVEIFSHKSESTGGNGGQLNSNNHNIYFEGRVNSTEGGGSAGGNMIPFPGPPPSFPFFPMRSAAQWACPSFRPMAMSKP